MEQDDDYQPFDAQHPARGGGQVSADFDHAPLPEKEQGPPSPKSASGQPDEAQPEAASERLSPDAQNKQFGTKMRPPHHRAPASPQPEGGDYDGCLCHLGSRCPVHGESGPQNDAELADYWRARAESLREERDRGLERLIDRFIYLGRLSSSPAVWNAAVGEARKTLDRLSNTPAPTPQSDSGGSDE